MMSGGMTLDELPAAPAAPHPHLDDWRTFLRAHALLSRRLDEELRSEHGVSLAEYDALVQLASAPGRRLRMNQLADRVLLSRSGITRLVDRLVADGFVCRTQCSSDARGAEAVLTDAGIDRLRTASTTHLRGVERYFLEPLSTDQLMELGQSLGMLVGRLRDRAEREPDDLAADDGDDTDK
jgi:DNA-binding MarR family transcriptional regulator